MDSIKGTREFVLQPSDLNSLCEIEVTKCTSRTSNDGFIPYNDDVSTVIVTIFDINGSDVTSELMDSTATVSANIITMNLKYPQSSGEGTYSARAVIDTDNGSTLELDFARIRAENRGFG